MDPKLLSLAKVDLKAARKRAERDRDPYKRTQSLGWIIRFAGEPNIRPVVDAAFKSAFENEDSYKAVASAAWPLRALGERGDLRAVRKFLPKVLALVPKIENAVARGDALFLLFQALLPIGETDVAAVLRLLTNTCKEMNSWKGPEILRDVALMIGAKNAEKARAIVAGMPECRARRQAAKRLDAGEMLEPRQFFWER